MMNSIKKPFIYLLSILFIWSFVLFGSLIWNTYNSKKFIDTMIKKDALANFNKDKAIRYWASKHGGVYVQRDKRTPSNENLAHIKDRDIVTESGKELTLMNPAYMLRQMMDEFPTDYGVKGRIVSDKPLWEPNMADEWEMKALKEFKNGGTEKSEFSAKDGELYFRYMKPMVTAKHCLKCHAHQGYKEGDIRGGVGVMVNVAGYMDNLNESQRYLIFSHLIIYTLGVILILIAYKNLNRYIEKLEKANNEIEKVNAELNIRVQKRTQELEDANKQLQELDQLKSMFVASMSHELRTPLNSIIGFTGVMLQGMTGELNEKQKDQLTRVKKAGEHLLSLISDVIDISKIEAGRVEATVEKFNLSELLHDAKDEVEIIAKPKKLEIVVDMPYDIELNTDKRRLYQCLLNYLSNSIKFTERSGEIKVQLKDEEDKITLFVIDNGIGISKEDQSKLFEAFERLETHLRVKPGGTGLGLYLTRKITEDLLRGSVSVQSTLGEGSIFSLTIPKDLEKRENYV